MATQVGSNVPGVQAKLTTPTLKVSWSSIMTEFVGMSQID